MKPLNQLRRIEVFIGGMWHEANLIQLGVGDLFRMFEVDGTPIEHKGCIVFQATGPVSIEADLIDSDGNVVPTP